MLKHFRLTVFCLCNLLCWAVVLGYPSVARAEESVPNEEKWPEDYVDQKYLEDAVIEEAFPDEIFREYVKQFDLDQDGVLGTPEKEAVTEMILPDGVDDLTGIRYFYNLESFEAICYRYFEEEESIGYKIPIYDMTAFFKLKRFVLHLTSTSAHSSVNLSGLQALTTVDIYHIDDDGFSTVNLNDCPALMEVKVRGTKTVLINQLNQVKTLQLWCKNVHQYVDEICALKQLEELYLSTTSKKITSLNLSKNVNLKDISIGIKSLNSIKFPKKLNADSVAIYNTRIKTLKIPDNAKIDMLDVDSTVLKSIKWGENCSIKELQISSKKLKKLDVSALTKLETLRLSDSPVSKLILNKKLKNLYYNGNNGMKTLDLRQYNLRYLHLRGSNVTELICNKNIKSIKIDQNDTLKHLDFSKYKKLETVCFDFNSKLKSVKFGTHQNLTYISCSFNDKLTALTIKKADKLDYFDCSDNKIKSLKVKHLKNLTRLFCRRNKLKTIDIRGLKKLKEFSCSKNVKVIK